MDNEPLIVLQHIYFQPLARVPLSETIFYTLRSETLREANELLPIKR